MEFNYSDLLFFVWLYAIGWPLSFYVLARWDKRECNPFDENKGIGIAWLSMFWPIIWSGYVLWKALDITIWTINFIGKPFDKFYDWSNK